MRILLISLLFVAATSASATEFWACDGFKATGDGSGGPPFLLKGTKSRYYYKNRTIDYEIKFIAENKIDYFQIYVDDTRNTHRNAFYLEFDGDQLSMKRFTNDGYNFVTTCHRQ